MTREEAIETLKAIIPKDSRGNGKISKRLTITKSIFMAINALEQTRWIPTSERLPEEDGEYLLYGKIDEDEDNYIFIGEYDACGEEFGIWQEQFDRHTLGCLGSEFFEYDTVLAWQPLPELYKEG